MAVRPDYDAKGVDICFSHLIEVFTILGEYREHVALVGGWVPFLLCNNPQSPHCGSLDIDLVLELDTRVDTYRTIADLLQRGGFVQGAQPFIFVKDSVHEDRTPFRIQVDLLAGEYGGTSASHRHQSIQDVKARKVRGADLVFGDIVIKTIQGRMPDGAINEVSIKIAGAVPFLVMKGMALGTRMEQKDAYDVFYVVDNYPGGIDSLVESFLPYRKHGLVIEGLGVIRSKFTSVEHVGSVWAAQFQAITDKEEAARVQRDAYEKVSRFLDKLDISGV